MRRSRPACVLILVPLVAFACGPSGREPGQTPPVEVSSLSAAKQQALSGTYRAHGLTVQARSGLHREVSGTLELEVAEGRYQVQFDLATTAPDFEEEVPVRVRGTGHGFLIGDIFTGTTEEWMALDPAQERLDGVRLRGVELPAKAGRKIQSTSQASFDTDGTFHVVLQNYPGPGEQYESSTTVLEARREPPN